MASFNYDFAFIQEQIIEPLLRQINNVKFIALTSFIPQSIHDDWSINFFPKYQKRAAWNSTKLAFEYILNTEFNNTSNPIYISNISSTDINVFLYSESEQLLTNQYYLFNDNVINGIYPVYNPFASYPLNTKVRYMDLVYVSRVPSVAFNSIFDTNNWLVDSYLYNESDFLNLIDFVVYVPLSLFTPDFDLKIKSFISNIKLFNTKFFVQYY